MFGNIGMGELIIIAGVALVVLGPEKFPEFAKIAMRAFRDLRGYVDDIKREMASELKPVQNEIRKLSQYNPEDYVENLAKAVASIDDEKPETATASEGETRTDTDEHGPEEAAGAAAKPEETAQPAEDAPKDVPEDTPKVTPTSHPEHYDD